ncbi:hypothetical protein KQX54_010730 [Cotesia glomerata]|uniref:Pre-C2HC domain-containing protein n=1 Tax=Cotesia glomerata TaxID=32391 RepID=A0AAV7IEQ1_COTGL|nr:hypothetical protein KQX54_010730 [Cotesia glomerata]
MTTFDYLKKILKEGEIVYYSYTPKNLRPKSVILKGISKDYDSKQVLEDFKQKNIPVVELMKVSELKFKNHKGEKKRHIIVQITQKTANCEISYRCLKCGESHMPDKANCPLSTATTRENFKCANCGKTGHPANYAGCEFIKFAKVTQNTDTHNKNWLLDSKIQRTNRGINPQLSFANVMALARNDFPLLKQPNPQGVNNLQRHFQLAPQQQQHIPQHEENFEQSSIQQLRNEINSLTREIRLMGANINQSITNNSQIIDFLFHVLELHHGSAE